MVGGIVACGPTHTAVTPLDLVKCRRQVDPSIYKSNMQAWRTIASKEGVRGIFFGWAPTLVGYSFQGAGKYGLYEVFKYWYGEKLFPDTNKTVVYLAGSASAEFFADIFLCPFEAIKVRMQTTLPPYAQNLREGWGKIVSQEGFGGLYKGLYPLWARQIPYTMVSSLDISGPRRYADTSADQILQLRSRGRADLQDHWQAQGSAQWTATDGCLLFGRLHCGHWLRGGLAPRRCHGIQVERRPQGWGERGSCDWPHLQEHWLHGSVEWAGGAHWHDRDSDRLPVADLRHMEGVAGLPYHGRPLIASTASGRKAGWIFRKRATSAQSLKDLSLLLLPTKRRESNPSLDAGTGRLSHVACLPREPH